MSVLFCPLDIPRIVPQDWDEWWHTWESSKVMPKVNPNHNPVAVDWLGLDLFVRPGYTTQYEAPVAEQNPTIVDLCKQVFDTMNFRISRIRVIENLVPVLAHTDNSLPTGNIRSFLWNTYEEPVWRFANSKESHKLIMPEETNSFFYLDGVITHEAIYDKNYSKGVLAVYGAPDTHFRSMVERSYKKYADISWAAVI